MPECHVRDGKLTMPSMMYWSNKPLSQETKRVNARRAIDDAVDDVLIEQRTEARDQQSTVDEDDLINFIEIPFVVEQTIEQSAGKICKDRRRK